ncbi:MAG: aspartate aminotransferase family protein [Bacilli bacterium]
MVNANALLTEYNDQPSSTTSSLMPTYNRFPLTIVKGKGSYVWDEQGKQYLDFTSGIATCNLGHAPDVVKEKVQQQLDVLWHCSNLYNIPVQQNLANVLVEHSCADQAFFCNSGAEANEAAIKIARRYAQTIKQNDAFEIITFTHSFHGRTLATLSATGQEKIQQGFQPLMPGFRYLPYNDLDALDRLLSPHTCAVMLELVQGEGGVIPADQVWIDKLVQICHNNDLLIMVDEIQTGMGRTGTLFAYEQYGFEPDVISLAKGLGSGFPIGAMLAKVHVAKAFDSGSHGSTFGGNPLAATAGLATLQFFLENNITVQSEKLGNYLHARLLELQQSYSIIEHVRGKGLLLGLVITGKALDIVHAAREKNVLILTAGPNVVRVLPPLTTTISEIDQFISVMNDILKHQ